VDAISHEEKSMNVNRILAELKGERARLDVAISAIEGITRTGTRRGRPAGSRRGRRRMSAAARKRISLAQKARWAKQKKAGKG